MFIRNQKGAITSRKIEIRRPQKASRRHILIKKICLLVGGLIFLGFGINFFLRSKIFVLSINQVEILGASRIAPSEIEAILQKQMLAQRFHLFPQNHILFFSSSEAIEHMKEAFIAIESIEIKKRPLNRLIIKLEESQPAITWISAGKYYYLDTNGMAIEEVSVPTLLISDQGVADLRGNDSNVQNLADSSEKQKAPNPISSESMPLEEAITDFSHLDQALAQVVDESNTVIKVGQAILSDEKTAFILSLDSMFFEKTGLKRKNYVISQLSATDIRLITQDNWTIFFEMKNPLQRQLENLVLIIKEKLPGRQEPIEYIDLRDPNNIIYLK